MACPQLRTSRKSAGKLKALPLFLLLTLSAHAAIEHPLRDPGKLNSPNSEPIVHVKTAKVLMADYSLLRRDFPQLRNLSQDEIDHWLLDNAAVLSKAQASQTAVNTQVQTITAPEGTATEALRPVGYGRALIVKVEGGLLDIKGAGALAPALGKHFNGLRKTYMALREYFIEKGLQRLFTHGGFPIETVGSYAVLDLGFDDSEGQPVGLLIRQAHTRPNEAALKEMGNAFLGPAKTRELELFLRKYGFTSADQPVGFDAERLNIQGTEDEKAVVDFGSNFKVVKEFSGKNALWYPDGDRQDSKPLISERERDARIPNPRLKLNWSLWGNEVASENAGGGAPNRTALHTDNLGFELDKAMRNFRAGTCSRSCFQDLYVKYIESIHPAADLQGWYARLNRCERALLP